MLLQSQTRPPYFPESDQATILRLGLHPLQHKDWLVTDEDFLQFQRHKQQMGERHHEKVFRALPASRPAQQEFGSYLLNYLQHYRPGQYKIHNNTLSHTQSGSSWPLVTDDLWLSSLWIQEDICLMEESAEGYRLTAASLCSPSNWKLEDKIGETVDRIHDPVPGYQQALADRVNRLLSGLKTSKPMLRYNWSLQANSELCWREDMQQGADSLHWRVERQTFLRLPETGAVVFGIRLFIHRFDTMAEHCRFETDLHTILARLPANMRNYKGLDKLLSHFRIAEGKK